MGGIELPQTIKLIAGGSVQVIISFKATQMELWEFAFQASHACSTMPT